MVRFIGSPQGLAQVDTVLPSFQNTLKQVTSAVAMTKTVVAAMGQKDLVDKLQECNDTVPWPHHLLETTCEHGE